MLETENKLLYILFTSEEQQGFLIRNLKPDFFENSINSEIFKVAKRMYEEGKGIDATLLNEELRSDTVTNQLADIILQDFVPSVMAKPYAEKLFKNYFEKRVKYAKTESEFKEVQELKNSFLFDDEKILHISYDTENFSERYQNKQNTAVYTLYSQLDSCIGSFMGGDYIALGAATGMGKTTLALNIARRICMQEKTVLYFSLEMPLDQLQNKFVCIEQKLNANKFRSFGFNLCEMEKYLKGLDDLKQWNLYTVCDFNLTPDKMRSYIEKQKKKKLYFVVLDYLGLMSGYANKSSYERITLFSRKIKLMAGEFNVPILVLVQLNRELKNRQDKRPQLSDIRESGAIEQDADFVLFAHREGYYDRSKPQNDFNLIIAKNRHGESNKILNFDFDLATQTIDEKWSAEWLNAV